MDLCWQSNVSAFYYATNTICFKNPPCFSHAQHWLSTYTFPWWNGNLNLGWADELWDWINPGACTQAAFPFVSTSTIWAFLPVDSDVCLMLRTVWDILNILPICFDLCLMLRIICEPWLLFSYFCQLILMSVCHWGPFVSRKCYLGVLANWLWHLSAVEYWVPLGHFANWLWCLIITEAHCAEKVLVWASVPVTLGASQVAQVVKNPPANAGYIRDVGLIPELGRSPGRWHGNPLQHSCLENTVDRGVWWATVHKVTKSWTRLKWSSTAEHSTSHPQRGFVTNLLLGLWMCIPFVWLVFLSP